MKITCQRLMVTKFKAKFIPTNYELELFKILKNLKQKDFSMKYYTKAFYKLTIWSSHRGIYKEQVSRYITYLRFNILDDVGMLKIDSVDNGYQYALNTKDNLKKKNQGSSQGKEKQDFLEKDKLYVVADEPKLVEPRKRIGEIEDYFELEDMVIHLDWGWHKKI